jgi:glycine/D-amino acid oxidase-like deaminating enzyme
MSAAFVPLSAWSDATRRLSPPARTPAQSETVDLAIVGAGILGLTTALHAARAGLSVRVVEARGLGEGASGLNGGQVIPGLKYDPAWLLERFGRQRGEALVRFAAGTADAVFDLIAQEDLAVPHTRNGWIQAAHTPAAAALAASRAKDWAAHGVAARLLDAGEIRALTGAEGYVGGWLDPRAGVIQPLAYTLELARIATAAGAALSTSTRAIRLSRSGASWEIRTAQGAVLKATSVLVATNAYADGLVPGLAQTLLPLHSFQIATAPLPASLLARILPGGQAVSDSRCILVYYRKSPDGRLVLGGRGSMREPTGPQGWAHLEHALTRLFPDLDGIPIERRWFGRVAMTLDHLPHLHEPEPGLIVAAGCQGRGVGLMTALAPRLVDYLQDRNPDGLPFPLTPIRPIPFHRFRNLGIGATIAWYRMLDAFDR